MKYDVTITFEIETDEYRGVQTEAQVERLVGSMLSGESDGPDTYEITATLKPIYNEGC